MRSHPGWAGIDHAARILTVTNQRHCARVDVDGTVVHGRRRPRPDRSSSNTTDVFVATGSRTKREGRASAATSVGELHARLHFLELSALPAMMFMMAHAASPGAAAPVSVARLSCGDQCRIVGFRIRNMITVLCHRPRRSHRPWLVTRRRQLQRPAHSPFSVAHAVGRVLRRCQP